MKDTVAVAWNTNKNMSSDLETTNVGITKIKKTIGEIADEMQKAHPDMKQSAKAIPDVAAFAIHYRNKLELVLNLQPGQINGGNSDYDNCINTEAFQFLKNAILETALGNYHGKEITVKQVLVPSSEKSEQEHEFTSRVARELGSTDSINVLYSNGIPYAAVSAKVLLVPFRNMETNCLCKWDELLGRLSVAEKSLLKWYLEQLIVNDNNVFLNRLIQILIKECGCDRINAAIAPLTETIPQEKQADGLGNLEGIFNIPVLPFHISSRDLLPWLVLVKQCKCWYDSERIENGRLFKGGAMEMEIGGEYYEALLPFGKTFTKKMDEYGLEMERCYVEKAANPVDSWKVHLDVKQKSTNLGIVIERIYTGSDMYYLEDFPYIFSNSWLSEDGDRKVHAFIMSYDMETRLDTANPFWKSDHILSQSKTNISINTVCTDIREVHSKADTEAAGSDKWNWKWNVYEFSKMPDMLTFQCQNTELFVGDREIGAMKIEYSSTSQSSGEEAYIGFDMGTSNTVVGVRIGTKDADVASLIHGDWLHSITGIPDNAYSAVQMFLRFCINEKNVSIGKIRTAAQMFADTEGNGTRACKNGRVFVLNSRNQYAMKNLLGKEKELSSLDSYHIYTDLKFGDQDALSKKAMNTFLRECMNVVLMDCIAKGVKKINLAVSYPNEQVKIWISSAWKKLMGEIQEWEMVKNNGVIVREPEYWTEARAAANYLLKDHNSPVAPGTGFAIMDFGDGTTDCSIFLPNALETHFEYKDQLSIEYGGDDIIVDSIIWAFRSNVGMEYRNIFDSMPDAEGEFEELWRKKNADGQERQELIKAAFHEIMSLSKEKEFYYESNSQHESENLRNLMLTLIEEYGLEQSNLEKPFFKSLRELILLRYMHLFYSFANYLQTCMNGRKLEGTFPVFLYGGAAKGLNLLTGGVDSLNDSDAGRLIRSVIAHESGFDENQILLVMDAHKDKKEVATGMIMELAPELKNVTDPQRMPAANGFVSISRNELSSAMYTYMKVLQELSCRMNQNHFSKDRELNSEWFSMIMADAGCSDSSSYMERTSDTTHETMSEDHESDRIPSASCIEKMKASPYITQMMDQCRRKYKNTDIPMNVRIIYYAARMTDHYLIKKSLD